MDVKTYTHIWLNIRQIITSELSKFMGQKYLSYS